jgi:hypothetical protein
MVVALLRERDHLEIEYLRLQVELDRYKKHYYRPRADQLQSADDLTQLLIKPSNDAHQRTLRLFPPVSGDSLRPQESRACKNKLLILRRACGPHNARESRKESAFKVRFFTKILNTKCRRGAGSTLKDQQHPMLSQQE